MEYEHHDMKYNHYDMEYEHYYDMEYEHYDTPNNMKMMYHGNTECSLQIPVITKSYILDTLRTTRLLSQID